MSPPKGHSLGVLGDSLSSVYGNQWEDVVVARTGATLAFQDARPGCCFYNAFECCGALMPGASSGNYQGPANPFCGYPFQVGATGHTLSQNLASVDMLLLRLDTNEEAVVLGSLGDSITSGTFYGNMRWVVETLLAAKPTIRLVVLTPELNTFGTVSQIENVVNAEVAYAKSMGLLVLNLYETSGNNAITTNVYTRDGTHPSDWAFSHVDGPAIAQFNQGWF